MGIKFRVEFETAGPSGPNECDVVLLTHDGALNTNPSWTPGAIEIADHAARGALDDKRNEMEVRVEGYARHYRIPSRIPDGWKPCPRPPVTRG